jgi:hypothetical protein
VREFLRNAFAVNDQTPCVASEEQRELLERLADEIARRRMTGPALAFLEMSRPLNSLGASAIHFFTPIASSLANPVALKHFAEFLDQRGSVDLLCNIIEAAQTRRDTALDSTQDASNKTPDKG